MNPETGAVTPPPQIVVLGAGGDLARRKLLPSVIRLAAAGQLPAGSPVVGFARRAKTDTEFRNELREGLDPGLRSAFGSLENRFFYQRGDVSEPTDLAALARRLRELTGGHEAPRLFYLALAPDLLGVAASNLLSQGLLSRGEAAGWRRVVLEKPFGRDLESARALNRVLHEGLREDQILRIDHYLAKETVRNLLGFRFHNTIFEPIWNRNYVDVVKITVAEELGVESRAASYDKVGALSDVVQSHLLQLLALIAMEPPASLEADAIRDQKVAVLQCLRAPRADEQSTVRARYAHGTIRGETVKGYLEEDGVAPDSGTETFVAVRAEIENWRWSGIPFVLCHGKRLAERSTEIVVQFRTPPIQLFDRAGSECAHRPESARASRGPTRPNVLTLLIQPREQIHLSFGVREPGRTMRMTPARLSFDYRERFGTSADLAYDRLLLEALNGDPSLFLRADEIEAAWRFVDEIREGWQLPGAAPLLEYPAGSAGPRQAGALAQRCGCWEG